MAGRYGDGVWERCKVRADCLGNVVWLDAKLNLCHPWVILRLSTGQLVVHLNDDSFGTEPRVILMGEGDDERA